MFTPKLFISIGSTHAYFTIRETFEHICKNQVEVRSYHIQNLSQDVDAAYDKAIAFSEKYAIELLTSKEQMIDDMRSITRMSAEAKDKIKKDLIERDAKWEAERQDIINSQLDNIKAGKFPRGLYFGKMFNEAPITYLNWIMKTTFEDVVMIALKEAVITVCSDVMLPVADKNLTIGSEGSKIESNVTVIGRYAYQGCYGGGVITKMVSDSGALIVTFGKFDANVGDKITVKFTVKKHEMYDDQMQTIVIRVKQV